MISLCELLSFFLSTRPNVVILLSVLWDIILTFVTIWCPQQLLSKSTKSITRHAIHILHLLHHHVTTFQFKWTWTTYSHSHLILDNTCSHWYLVKLGRRLFFSLFLSFIFFYRQKQLERQALRKKGSPCSVCKTLEFLSSFFWLHFHVTVIRSG